MIVTEQLEGEFVPKSYVAANECLQQEFLHRQTRQASHIVSFSDIRKLLVRSVPEFHDNQQFLVRELRFLHSNGAILYHESANNKFVVLEPYTCFTNILS